MAPVAFSFVVRFSSEDAIFKAENLCKGKADAMGTWKCAKEDTNCGRMEAEFQLEKASYISHIDIGNCGSAFIEILVGNSMWPQDKPFITLLPSAMLMNPVDCKQWNKTHSVRMFNQSAFSKEAAGSQWDRLRVICRQPFRKDKQFGLSFIRVRSVGDDDAPPSPEGVSGKTATSPSVQSLNDEDDEDGITRLKKASGLMGCIRSIEKGSPESPLNRAGRMLQAALDSRSPTTPANRPRNKSSSSPEMLSSPESPFGKRNCQSHSEGPKEKRNKPERKWSLVGDIQDEVSLFLEDIDFTKIDLQNVTFKDLRDQMEAQRGCSLTKQEKKVFLQMAKAAIAKAMPPIDDSDQEDAMEIFVNEQDASPSVTKTKGPNRTRKKARESSSKTSISERKTPSSKTRSPPPSASTSISIDDDTEDLPSMLHSSQDDKPSSKEFYRTNGDFQPSPVREKTKKPNRTGKKAGESSSKTPNSERKTPSSKTRGRPLPLDIFDVDVPSASTSLSIDDDTEDLPSMLHSSQDNTPSRKEKEFYRTSGDFQPLPPRPPIRKKSSEPMVECPICSTFFPASDVEFHAALCTNEASCTPYVPAPEPNPSGDYKPSPVKKTSSEPMVECPICNKLFPASDVEFHAALCTNEAGCTPYVPAPEPEESMSFPIAI